MTAEWTWHGGALEAAKKHFGAGEQPWLDLSTGINPHRWPGAGGIAIDWHRLPEREALAGLEAAAAAHFGAHPHHVCAVPGSEIGLRLIGRILGGSARYVTPSYRTHGEIFADMVSVRLDEVGIDGTLILANPNNPDGRIISVDTVEAMLAKRKDWLLVDEAFADCDPAISIAHHVDDHARLLAFRSFGKFFGLAGVRLGFVIGPPAVLAPLRDLLGAWPVSTAAIGLGTAAYRDRRWIETMRERLRSEAAALDVMLADQGLTASGDCPLFRLLDTENAAALFERLARAEILTRPFADQPRWLRIGLPGSNEALGRLEAALAHG